MTRIEFALTAAMLGLATIVTPAPLAAQDAIVTGAAEASLPDGSTFNGLALKGLTVGLGISIARDATASGQFHAELQGTTLLGLAREIVIEGEVSTGSVAPDGSATFSGRATVNMGDGGPPLPDVPFTATVSTGGVKLTLNGTALPSAAVTAGSISVK
jgi:hypothetical protein